MVKEQGKINLITKHAESLRRAGVARFELTEHGMIVDLFPYYERPPIELRTEEPGAFDWLPGYERPARRDGEQ